MAHYATLADLYTLGIPEPSLERIPEADRETGLVAACDMVDSYLRERFTLPLLTHGTDITRAACIIAAYDLMTANGLNPANAGDDSTQLDKRYEGTIDWLRDVAKGLVTPVVTDSSPTPSAGGASGLPAGGYVVAPRLSDDGCGYVVGPPRSRGW